MIDINMIGVQVAVGTTPDGMARVLKIIDPQSGISVTVPLDIEAAKAIGLQLSSSVLVASSPLPKRSEGVN